MEDHAATLAVQQKRSIVVTTETHPTRTAEDGGQDKVLAALATLGQATANEIADHAGLGYSTVTARLRKLADAGTVHKQPPGTGPTSWRLADPAAGPDNQPEAEDQPVPDNQPEEAEPDQAESDQAESIVDDVDGAEPDGAEHDLTAPTRVEPGTDQETAAPASPEAEAAGGTPGPRRPPGKLRVQVLGVLQDHPEEPFTPHQISKLLGGASSGAIVLACRKLVAEGSAKQVRERPATFQAE